MGADSIYPCVTLFTVQSLPPQDQAIGGGIVNAMGALGRTVILAIGTAIETSVREKGIRAGRSYADAQLDSYRAVNWFSFALAVVSTSIAVLVFRGAGIIGVKK